MERWEDGAAIWHVPRYRGVCGYEICKALGWYVKNQREYCPPFSPVGEERKVSMENGFEKEKDKENSRFVREKSGNSHPFLKVWISIYLLR